MTTVITYEGLKKKTVADLRELAKSLTHEAVQGYTQMNKEHLLPALCRALGVDTHEHHVVHGIDKAAVKAQMKALQRERDAALDAGDGDRVKSLRRHIHTLNHQLRVHAR